LNILFPCSALFSLPASRKYICISGSHGSIAGDSKSSCTEFGLEDEGTTILGIVRNYTSDTVSHIGRLEVYGGVPPPGFGRTLWFHKTSSAVPP
jgi:hypothetical protein